jgi:hypothetical protein
MKFWQKRRAKHSVEGPNSTDDPFDPAIWKDKQDILQIFHISPRTLARWRDKNSIGMKRKGKKFFYNIHDVNRSFISESATVEERVLSWPYPILWTAVVGLAIFFWIISDSLLEAALYTAVPVIIAVPAQTIMWIKKRKRKKD